MILSTPNIRLRVMVYRQMQYSSSVSPFSFSQGMIHPNPNTWIIIFILFLQQCFNYFQKKLCTIVSRSTIFVNILILFLFTQHILLYDCFKLFNKTFICYFICFNLYLIDVSYFKIYIFLKLGHIYCICVSHTCCYFENNFYLSVL